VEWTLPDAAGAPIRRLGWRAIQQGRQLAEQLARLDGLAEVVGAAGLETLLPLPGTDPSGQGYHLDAAGAGSLHEFSRDLETWAVGQPEVQQDQLGCARRDGAQSLLGCACFPDFIAGILEQEAEGLTQQGIVFNQQDGSGGNLSHVRKY
jgi:hypothetical protein